MRTDKHRIVRENISLAHFFATEKSPKRSRRVFLRLRLKSGGQQTIWKWTDKSASDTFAEFEAWYKDNDGGPSYELVIGKSFRTVLHRDDIEGYRLFVMEQK